jgi:hypothetical protein
LRPTPRVRACVRAAMRDAFAARDTRDARDASAA